MKQITLSLFLLASISNLPAATFSLIIEGQPGSSEISVSGSGSLAGAANTAGRFVGTAVEAPRGTGYFTYGVNLTTDIFGADYLDTGSSLFDLVGDLRVEFSGGITGSILAERITLENEGPGSDDVGLRNTSNVNHPASTSPFTYTLTGTSTTTLRNGNTFDDFIIGEHFDDTLFGPDFDQSFSVIVRSIPEPSALALSLFALAAAILRRRIRSH